MRKTKLTKRLRNLGFSEKIIAIFDVFRDFFELEPVVMTGKYGITVFFKCKNELFKDVVVVNEDSVEEIENTFFNKMRSGRLFSISTTDKKGAETLWNVPPFSSAKELRMKLQLNGFVQNGN